MKSFFLTLVITVFVGSAAYAQNPPGQPPPPTPAPQAEPSDAQPMTITGCLTKGGAAGEYTITDNKSGERTTFMANDRIERFVNQTVQLTGSMTRKGADKAFRPSAVTTVAATCESSVPKEK